MTKNKTGGGAYFPQAYLTDMFRFLQRNNDKIEIITYQDLHWGCDYDFAKGYPKEKKRWLTGIKNGEFDNTKAYVLLQYDLDSRPERAMRLLEHPAHQAIPANVMRFAKRVDRKLLKTTNELEYTDYELDIELLNQLTKKNFLIGYHSNCYERSHHHIESAPQILDEDIQALKKQHNIDFYTAHGGVACEKGLNNRDIVPNDVTSQSVRWVHNGATPFFNKQFSDGGHNAPSRDPAARDIRDFVANFKPGERYRILVHPQYYDTSFSPSKRYSGTLWYDNMLKNIEQSSDYNTWEGVSLINFKSDDATTNNHYQITSPLRYKFVFLKSRIIHWLSSIFK